jgi:D-alanyl-D-alanine carboxypeptidase
MVLVAGRASGGKELWMTTGRCKALRSFVSLCRHSRLVFLAMGLVWGSLSTACSPLSRQTSALKAKFESELNALHEEYQFPGATAAYALSDGTVQVVAVGLADVERKVPMEPASRMLAASIGKTFVAATIVALAKEKQLDLDAAISNWLGDLPWFSKLPNHNAITWRHLLTHTAGLANHLENADFAKALQANWPQRCKSFSPESCIGFVLNRPALFEPGEDWHYSDTGYLLVGLIIEDVTGRTYYDELKRRFLVPLGLTLTIPSDRPELPGLAAGYMAADNAFGLPQKTTVRTGKMAWDPGLEWTGGGLAINPWDLVLWAKALFEGNAMDGDYLQTMLDSVPVSKEAPTVRYGLGVAIHEDGAHGPTYGHGGWIPGYSSSLRYYRRHGVAIAFQINTDIGIVDDSTDLFEEMEDRLARVVINDAKD